MLSKPISRRRHGFTLIEMMIVLSILSILFAILLPVLMRARLKSYHTACIQNERNIATALQLYANENENLYPDSLSALTGRPGSAFFIQSIAVCPSNRASYSLGYSVTEEKTEYLLACPGIHDIQLPGLVQDSYPRFINGQLYPNGPP